MSIFEVDLRHDTSRRVRIAPVIRALLVGGLLAIGCSSSPSSPSSALKTYRSVWVNASWSAGRIGPPLSSKSDGPGSFNGRFCPASGLVLENHGTRFQNIFSWAPQTLVFKNTCDMDIDYRVCVTAGTSINSTEFPVCNADPRTTPIARLAPISLSSPDNDFANTSLDRSLTWANSGLNLDINIFYCGEGDSFTLNVVNSRNPTDCLDTN